MAAVKKINKEGILEAAYNLARREGIAAITARKLAKEISGHSRRRIQAILFHILLPPSWDSSWMPGWLPKLPLKWPGSLPKNWDTIRLGSMGR